MECYPPFEQLWPGESRYSSFKQPGQRAKKVVSDNPGLVNFAMGLVILVLNLPDGQVVFFGEIQITEGLIKKGLGASWNDLWASTY